MKSNRIKASIWQHASVVMLMLYLVSTFLMNLCMLIGECFKNIEAFLSKLVDFVFEACYVFRICLTDCAFLRPVSDPQLDNTRMVTVIVTLVACICLMYLATLIYKKCAKTVIKLFIVLVFLDFIATVIFMVYPLWLSLSLKALLILVLLLALGTAKNTDQ
ncbi:MAG: hypothetical protein IJ015_05375 [Ruminococcus sp.]|nr:hypothetical protein [Ruminococcus sp.]